MPCMPANLHIQEEEDQGVNPEKTKAPVGVRSKTGINKCEYKSSHEYRTMSLSKHRLRVVRAK